MPVSIVVGGQYGSEGKGKVAHYLAREMQATYVVRCGGPNSGHTVIDEQGKARIFQQLPTSAIIPGVKLVICAGSYVNLDILIKEIRETNVDPGRLFVDPKSIIITEELKDLEVESGIMDRIGSTGTGTGTAVAARARREPSLRFARDIPELRPFTTSVSEILRSALDKQERIIIEGTQGFGLSCLHSPYYPYVTSRDTTAAAFLAEAGLSPLDVDDVVLTIRAFPIRVAGNSGPMSNEIDWETIRREGRHPKPFEEKTSVTKKLRRVARFEPGIVQRAIIINRPTTIVLNHVDYICSSMSAERDQLIQKFVKGVEDSIKRKINYLGYGPESLKLKLNKLA